LFGFWKAFDTPLVRNTLLFSVIYYLITGLCITAGRAPLLFPRFARPQLKLLYHEGYHRLWAHRSYAASRPLKYFLALFGTGSLTGSIIFWARDHRAHHRFTDTANDPYNVRGGFWYAHILWLILKQPKRQNRVDISDLRADPLVKYQHRYYFPIAFFMTWGFPTLVAGLGWGDWYGGFIYGGIIRTCLVQQATFCVNSMAHYFGDQTYDDIRSARDHFITSVLALGEGYHNFHHQFPTDYRNGIEVYHFDITKWLIALCSHLRLAGDLKRFRYSEIQKCRLQQATRRLDEKKRVYDWGPRLEDLPLMSWTEYEGKVKSGSVLLVVDGVVHDVAGFVGEHPGGENMILAQVGKDGSAAFNGGVYNHSNAARNYLATLRVAVLVGGGEVEAWK
jgi:stearoyl-CoA desaturase (delta-9 desaturase)